MEKKQTQFSQGKSVRSKMSSENKKTTKDSTTTSKSEYSTGKRQKSPMGTEVHFAPSKYSDPEFIDQLYAEGIEKILSASANLDYSSSEIESENLLPMGTF